MAYPWILFIAALLLLMLEFYLPGGIMAVLSAFVYFIAFYDACVTFPMTELAIFMLVSCIAPIVVITMTLRSIKKSGYKNTFYLSKSQEGFSGSEFDSTLIGKTGVALTDLSPSGFAYIENHRVQVISQSGYLEKGTKIMVKDGRGGYLLVQKM